MIRNLTATVLPLCLTASLACHATTEPEPLVGCGNRPVPVPAAGTHPSGASTVRAVGFAGRPFGIRVSSGGIVYVTQQDGNSVARVRLTDLVASPPIAVGADPGDVVFTRDGRTAFVSNFNDGTVHVLDVATGARRRQIFIAATNAYRLALAPDDSRLYVTTTNGRLYSVDVMGVEATTSTYVGGSLQGIALARDGRTLFASSTTGDVWRLNACTLAVTGSVGGQGRYATQDIALGPSDSTLYVASEGGFVDVLDASTLQSTDRVSMAGYAPFGLAMTPDGAQMYITSPTTGDVAIVDRVTGGLVKVMRVGGVPRRVAFDATGSAAVVSNEGNWVDVIR